MGYGMLHNEDRELKIRLAELQADVQIWLTFCFGLLGFLIATILSYVQIFFSSSPEAIAVKGFLPFLIVVMAFLFLGIFHCFTRKVQDAKRQMAELRKRYVW